MSKQFSVESRVEIIEKIRNIKGFIALWDFSEPAEEPREAFGQSGFLLSEVNGPIPRVNQGPISGYSAKFDGSTFLRLPNSETGTLNIFGTNQGVTVVAWVKWTGEQTGFVGGMWNEYKDGGRRQYGLFVSLPYYNGKNQVCGHISKTGKPTPPFPYSIDYSASPQIVEKDQWQCLAFTYDGQWIKSYLNGEYLTRELELIDHTIGFEGYANGLLQSKNPFFFPDGIGNNGSDFTVGAVLLKAGMGNFFKGLIGGLAVFECALNAEEVKSLS